MRVAIVGYGGAGRQHEEAIRQVAQVSLAGILDTDDEILLPEELRLPSWDAVLSDSTIDTVALCLPPGGRADRVVEALRANKKVLVEKPPAMSVAEFDRIVAEPGTVAVMLQHRFRLPREALLDWPGGATGVLLVSRPRDAVRHYRGWRGDSGSALGGIMAHLGVHYLDLACQVLGEVERVEIADYHECAPGIDLRSSGLIRFTSGATLNFTVTADVSTRAERLILLADDRRLEIRDGAVEFQRGDEIVGARELTTSQARARVYGELSVGPDRSALHRTRPAMVVLDALREMGAR
ncbi:Gfo/Idh/MocA family oxidoreductase [Streptosporangium sp. NPDC049644]|uniref:Gfo/Idh/MocA family protein n=1 Tax=Streptosporangium sp. NPDC049644 TaxID=3155507 RepID=UPI00342656F5